MNNERENPKISRTLFFIVLASLDVLKGRGYLETMLEYELELIERDEKLRDYLPWEITPRSRAKYVQYLREYIGYFSEESIASEESEPRGSHQEDEELKAYLYDTKTQYYNNKPKNIWTFIEWEIKRIKILTDCFLTKVRNRVQPLYKPRI